MILFSIIMLISIVLGLQHLLNWAIRDILKTCEEASGAIFNTNNLFNCICS